MMPRYEPTDEQRKTVRALVGYGLRHEQICEVIINPRTKLPITEKTLRHHFKKEISEGGITANSLVAQSLFAKATGNGPSAVTAAIFWLKCRAGWKETNILEHVGKDGDPIERKPTQQEIEDAIKAISDKV